MTNQEKEPLTIEKVSESSQTETAGPLPKTEEKNSRDKLKTSLPMRLLNVLVILLLGYGVYNYLAGNTATIQQQALLDAEVKKKGVTSVLHTQDFRIDQLKEQDAFNVIGKAFPKIRINVVTTTLKAGDGRRVSCGQTVTYRVHEGVGGAGIVGKEQTIRLGDVHDNASKGLSWGIEGAQIGEIRELNIPKDFTAMLFSTSMPEAEKKVVEILAATPEFPKAGEMPLRRFIQRGGAGYGLRCGDHAIAHMTLWDSAGKMLFSSLGGLPIYFEVGAGKGVPLGIELAAQEMGPEGEYTVIVPKELMMPLHINSTSLAPPKGLEVQPFPHSIALPKEGVLIVDLSFPKDLPLKQEPRKELPMPEF